MKNIYDLIASSYSQNESDICEKYQPSELELERIIGEAQNILRRLPYTPYQCAPMSAMWAASIVDNLKLPAYVVCGALKIDQKLIFAGQNIEKAFLGIEQEMNWDLHCWVQFGNFMGDISLFRTAYHPKSPDWLRNMIISKFGNNRDLLFARNNDFLKLGLEYEAKYVLTDKQIAGVLEGFLHKNNLLNSPHE